MMNTCLCVLLLFGCWVITEVVFLPFRLPIKEEYDLKPLTGSSALSFFQSCIKMKSRSCGFSCYCYFLSKPLQLKVQLWSIAAYSLSPVFHSWNSTTAALPEYFSSRSFALWSLSDHSISSHVYSWIDNFLSLDFKSLNTRIEQVLLTVFSTHCLL